MRLIHSPCFLWLLLAVPSIPMTMALIAGNTGADATPVTEALLHPTGEFSARFMIIALAISPLGVIFPASKFIRWLKQRRRYFGVAAFAYALAHTVLYAVDMGSLKSILAEFFALGIWTGWLAFFIFIPLAITSNDFSEKLLARRWKTLQQLVYLAAIATLLHWMFVHNEFGAALVHFVPLAALECFRLWRHFAARSSRSLSA